MTERPSMAVPGTGRGAARIEGKLEPDAIGVTQDTVIGMASSAPAGTVAATLAALAVATAYGSGPVLLLCDNGAGKAVARIHFGQPPRFGDLPGAIHLGFAMHRRQDVVSTRIPQIVFRQIVAPDRLIRA